MEQQLLSAAFFHRGSFEEIQKYNIKSDLSDKGQALWDMFTEFYSTDAAAQVIDKVILLRTIDRKIPKFYEQFKSTIDNFEDTSTPNLLKEIIATKKDRVGLELTQALSLKQESKIFSLWKEWEALANGELETNDDSSIIIAPELGKVFEGRTLENRIPIYPDALTKQLEGGALPGHHIVLFAPTDMGKTFFVLNMIRGFIEHKYKVLYVCNEDPVSDLIERFLVCLTGKDKWTIRRNYSKAQRFAEKLGWHNLVWAELSPGTLLEIDGLIVKHKPDILVVDQILNLDTGNRDEVSSFALAAKAMRNWAKHYKLLSVSVTQAADSATGKAVLGRGDIYMSNVGIPGTADLMMGIGATSEQEFDGVRTLSFPKQKISGNKQPLMIFLNHDNMRVE